MELLFHAASKSDATARMELLSKGGELINFVWLAMAHLGLGDESSSSAKETSKVKMVVKIRKLITLCTIRAN
ncbi:unnamed protein product [Arabis nemorensis]|uniref:Uncharacterized protein n=1 Tax=Arabis nemorensis TaxID=586526 RepID=A0A565C336_9BRAS|nr:unnamed protein product [Arabis nemorensis]